MPLSLCPNGHSQVDPQARFCLQCGAPLQGSPPEQAAPLSFGNCGLHPARPAQLACPRCGTFACPDCVVPQPDGAALCVTCDSRASSHLPWDRRESLGTLRAFWATCWGLVARPSETLGIAASAAPLRSSVWFAVLANVAASSTMILVYVVLFGFIGIAAFLGGDREDGLDIGIGIGTVFALVIAVVVLVVGMGAAGTLLNAAFDHLVLRISGARPKGFAVTMRATSLSLAPAIVALVPFCGIYVYPVWALVLRVFTYRRFHGISTGHAALAALALPGLLVLLGLTFYLVLLATAFSLGAAGDLDGP